MRKSIASDRSCRSSEDLDPGPPSSSIPWCDPSVSGAIRRRIVDAQALYAFGALLCAISTYWSIAFMVLVQLNFAIAPRIPFLSRI
jgi:hypothetical protein